MSLSSLVAVLSTGGTISSRRQDAGAVVATDGAQGLTHGIAVAQVTLETRDVMRVGSYQMGLEDLAQIADAVAAELGRDEVAGIVVTHGTDTLEETAFLLDLVHDDPRPVVITGAQRPADVADSDGPRNLADAISLAAHSDARGLGVLVGFGGEIFPARGTRKIHTTNLAAFDHPDGRVGTISGSDVHVTRGLVRPKALRWDGALDARVDIVLTYPGADVRLLWASVEAGARGIVVAGMGIGNAPPGFAEAISAIAAEGVVVALSTRVQAGPVRPVYGNGGGADLVAAGAIPISNLPASQARILLAAALTNETGAHAVRCALSTFG